MPESTATASSVFMPAACPSAGSRSPAGRVESGRNRPEAHPAFSSGRTAEFSRMLSLVGMASSRSATSRLLQVCSPCCVTKSAESCLPAARASCHPPDENLLLDPSAPNSARALPPYARRARVHPPRRPGNQGGEQVPTVFGGSTWRRPARQVDEWPRCIVRGRLSPRSTWTNPIYAGRCGSGLLAKAPVPPAPRRGIRMSQGWYHAATPESSLYQKLLGLRTAQLGRSTVICGELG